MKFKNGLLILCMIVCLFSIASVCAGEANETAMASHDDAEISIDDLESIESETLAEDNANDEIIKSGLDNVDKLKSSKTYVMNNSNVEEIFSGENDTLADYINEGDTIDVQGTIDKNRYLRINKPVNIISSSKNAVINLHTVIGDSVDGIPKFSFVFTAGASGSNVSDLYINNTQTWIYNADNLYFQNMIISVRSAFNLGAEIGHTAIRYCNNVTMDNCSIFTENTQAPCIVLQVTSNFTLINSKIEGQSKIGPL